MYIEIDTIIGRHTKSARLSNMFELPSSTELISVKNEPVGGKDKKYKSKSTKGCVV